MEAIQEGIKSVGIGRKGSKSLSADLSAQILSDLVNQAVSGLEKGAFYAGLIMKGVSPTEQILMENFSFEELVSDAPLEIQNICQNLLTGEELDFETAYVLGQFLFSSVPGEGARGLASSVLRVRYESEDEYAGLLQAMEETFHSGFNQRAPKGAPIIQIAEPFDGVDHSFLNTPLLADDFAQDGFRVINLVGRNSGPKYGNNLYDLARCLEEHFLENSLDCVEANSYYIDQAGLSPAMNQWVDRRRRIIKRPFLATLERFVNPLKCDVLIASAFHPPYGDKMLGICERAGIPASIIVRNGLEGTTNFPLLRDVKITATIQHKTEYVRKEFIFSSPKKFKLEEKYNTPSLEENIRLIQEYRENQHTSNEHFNTRIQLMRRAFKEIIGWMKEDYDFLV